MEGQQESWYLGWNSLYLDRCRGGDELYDLWIQHHILANIPLARLSQVAAATEWIVWGLSFHPRMLCSCSVAQLCLTLWDPMDCTPPGSYVHGISQAIILEWVVISYSRGSSPPKDPTHISGIFYIGKQILYHCATWEAHMGAENLPWPWLTNLNPPHRNTLTRANLFPYYWYKSTWFSCSHVWTLKLHLFSNSAHVAFPNQYKNDPNRVWEAPFVYMLVYGAEWATEDFSIRNRGNVLICVLSPVVIGSDTTPWTTHWDTRQRGLFYLGICWLLVPYPWHQCPCPRDNGHKL